jgi:hypothetical protein
MLYYKKEQIMDDQKKGVNVSRAAIVDQYQHGLGGNSVLQAYQTGYSGHSALVQAVQNGTATADELRDYQLGRSSG